jgi:predicted metal-dependent HD superfamily phosphohydrolase
MLSNVDIYWGLRIKSIFQKLWIAEKWQQLYKEIKALYDTPERRYHNWFHIVACLNNLYEIKEKISEDDFNILFFAIIFHDCIYNATAKKWENEENSALFAEKYLEKIWIEWNKEKIKNLIQLTAWHTLKKWKDIEKYMIDIDLSILWSNWETYLQYTKSIRHEYSQYSDETYRKWRLDFLQWIQQRKIFQTPHFQEKYEKQARENIEKEIEILKK